ncbi:MAG TPA: TIR domain-containing protein [Ktedonobacterales bacterium]|jgi:hypothetical protein|nr:TIR domain-containing protein [Ktedonobacterales bacterium]
MPAPPQPAPRVFVSHSHADNDYCRAFVNGLRTLGLDVWYDEHNLGWGQLRQTIDRELQRCRHFVAILSPAAVASDWVNMEIDAALALLRKQRLDSFLLIVARVCDIPVTLEGFKRIEAPNGRAVGVEEAVRRTVHVIQPARVETLSQPVSQPAGPAPTRSQHAAAPLPVAPLRVMRYPVAPPSPAMRAEKPGREVVEQPASTTVHRIKHPMRAAPWRLVMLTALAVLAAVATIIGVPRTLSAFNASSSQPHAAFIHSAMHLLDPEKPAGIDNALCFDFNARGSTGDTLSYSWDFGDVHSGLQASAHSATATYCYPVAGDYTVTLTVTDRNGRQDTITGLVHAFA